MKTAKWIWCAEQDVRDYNLAAIFRKDFNADVVSKAVLRITADSRYRVSINGTWINDGPGKAYPEHWKYDVYNISHLLKNGANRIEIIARYYGIGTFHQIPQQAGLLAEIDLDGELIGTDSSWEGAPYEPLRKWSPKVSVQMEPAESFDARISGKPDWKPAVEMFAADKGPWKDLSARGSRPLTKHVCKPKSMHGSAELKRKPQPVCVPVVQIAHPGVIEANHNTSKPVILASVLSVGKSRVVDFTSEKWFISVDGTPVNGEVELEKGSHTVLFFCESFFGHDKEFAFPFLNIDGCSWGEWKVFVNDKYIFRDDDLRWFWFTHPEVERVRSEWFAWINKASGSWKNPEEEIPELGREADIPFDLLFMEDYTADFAEREPLGPADSNVVNETGICEGGKGSVTVNPVKGRDVELCYDMGEQCCGFFKFSFKAAEGTVLDMHLVEYITPEGVVQHTAEHNRNGMRYISRDGLNEYTSLKRRSGRFLFVSIRNQTGPVELVSMEMIESNADVKPVARFRCSDEKLDLVWDACERTLRMGMEDTFTDCSLYEQSLWIGDARNQAQYAFNVYCGYDISERSLELGAQSLDRFPIVGCQVPSGWDCLLPAWSFLWGIHVWEHYFYSGDERSLRKLWPAVLRNIDGAFKYIDENGLFSGPFWNMFDWVPIDCEHETVIHNSILLVGTLRAAENCAKVLGDDSALKGLQSKRRKLVKAINAWWDDTKRSYPDAILEDGKPSPNTCQHNSVLAILYDVAGKDQFDDARENLLNPPEGMTLIGSPFAAQYYFEALQKLGEPEAIMESIRKNYIPMIEEGATTVWETFPDSTCSPPGFPTRSHCHGWSCGPLMFFNSVILGIHQQGPGGKDFEISPWISGLTYAKGAMSTPKGPVYVDWEISGDILNVRVFAPKTVKAEFKPNASLEGFDVRTVIDTWDI